jgi:hypothetical protein
MNNIKMKNNRLTIVLRLIHLKIQLKTWNILPSRHCYLRWVEKRAVVVARGSGRAVNEEN